MTTDNNQPTLAELILAKKGERTYAKLSRDCGDIPTSQRLNSLVHKPMKAFPDAETMERLSIGLRVNVVDVVLASARSLGLPVSTSDPGSLMLAGAGNLPGTAKEALASMAQELLKLQQESTTRKTFTEYQAQLRQDFIHGARLRRVPATEIEAALLGPAWYMIGPDDDDLTAVDAILGWFSGDHVRQLKASLRDVFAEGTYLAKEDLGLAADLGEHGLDPEADIPPA